MYKYMLLLHVICATVWTGGHLILSITILPGALKKKSPSDLLRFETSFEKIGIPALIIQAVTGAWLSYNLMPDVGKWFSFGNPVSQLIFFKLILLLLTVLFALDARLRIIPNLTEQNMMSITSFL